MHAAVRAHVRPGVLRTLEPTCGAAGTQCHSRAGAKGSLIFADIDEAHQHLLERGRIVPGDAACSPMIRRTETTGNGQMPPRDRLPANERCALVQWVAQGAQR